MVTPAVEVRVAVDVPLARPVCALDAEQERREDAAVVGDPLGLDWAARAYSTRDVARVSTYSGSIVAIAFTATCRALGDKTPPPHTAGTVYPCRRGEQDPQTPRDFVAITLGRRGGGEADWWKGDAD